MRFLEQLRQRKLFQWAAAYLAGAWLVLQVVEVLAGPWGWSDRLVRAVQLLLGVGFLVTLVLAWYHGEKGRQRVSGAELGILAGLLVAAALLVSVLAERAPTPERPGPGPSVLPAGEVDARSVAVLPFRDLSPAADQQYFADGVAEEILAALSRVEDLKVAARTSSFALRGRDMDARAIGRTLGVRALLEGSVRKVGNRVRIQAQLVSADDGFELWSSTFDRELRDIFVIQDEIAGAITLALDATLGEAGTRSLAAEGTLDLDAYDLYLLGRHHWARRDPESLGRAIEYFQAAIARDPEYARAYAGLADAYSAAPWYGAESSEGTRARAQAAAARALELAPGLAEAHASLGVIASEYEWEWERAERHLARAVELSPSYASARQWYQTYLSNMGRSAEAVEQGRAALRLDPLSAVIAGDVAATFATAEDWEGAFRLLDRLVEMETAVPIHYFERAVYLLHVGRLEEGSRELVRWASRLGGADEPGEAAWIGAAVGDTTARPRARALLRRLEESGALDEAQAIPLHILVGDLEGALARVERAVAQRSVWVMYMGTLHWYDGLRPDPRFSELLAGLGLPNGRAQPAPGPGP